MVFEAPNHLRIFIWYFIFFSRNEAENTFLRLSVLHPEHLKFFLLTLDPAAASLAFKCSEQGGLAAMRMYGLERGAGGKDFYLVLLFW